MVNVLRLDIMPGFVAAPTSMTSNPNLKLTLALSPKP